MAMAKISVALGGRQFERDGEPYLLTVDTAWSALVDATEDEWREYLQQRSKQRFNTVAVSLLPIPHDHVEWAGARHPFELTSSGMYDFDRINADYLANVRSFCTIAAEYGITLATVLLWCNYVPGTWGARLTPGFVMSSGQRERWVSAALAGLSDLDPIVIVSGDDHFTDPGAIDAYSQALSQVRREAPGCLTTMHSSPLADLPDVIAASPDLDFYSYQSGHFLDRQHLAWELANLYHAKPVSRPIVNLEPCYEQLGTAEGTYRFRQSDVRRAVWASVLGGANAGVGYGAHGLWQWYFGQGETKAVGPWLEPFHWRAALEQPGADDAVFAMDLVRRQKLVALQPDASLLQQDLPGFYSGRSADGSLVAVYAPFCRSIELVGDFAGFALEAWDLEKRQPAPVEWASHSPATLPQIDSAADFLFIARASRSEQ